MKYTLVSNRQTYTFKGYKMINQQKGLTLFELLIAMAIGLLVISGVVRMVSHSITNERFIASEAEIQESLSYIDNRLSFMFKEALSSPCGNLDAMMADPSNPNVSYVKRATIGAGSAGNPQNIPNVIIQQTPLPSGVAPNTIRQNDFPMLLTGIAGATNSAGASIEPTAQGGRPFSASLPNIVAGSEYVIIMETSEKLLLNTTSVQGVRGGTASGGALGTSGLNVIPTSTITNRVGLPPMPHIITNCKQADIFMPNAPITATGIPIPANLFFSGATGGYKASESIISQLEMYAYYISQPPGQTPSFSRINLTLLGGTPAPTPQALVGGITNITFEWGLGDPTNNVAQGFFTTQDILNGNIDTGYFRRNLISVRVTTTAQGFDNNYLFATDSSGVQTNLTQTATRIYTIRNKMQRI